MLLLESRTNTLYTKNPLSGCMNAATAEEFEPPTALYALVIASFNVVWIFALYASIIGLSSDIEPVQFAELVIEDRFVLPPGVVVIGVIVVLLLPIPVLFCCANTLLLGSTINVRAIAMLDKASK